MEKKPKTAILEFLGTGTSTGVPVPGCGCAVCSSTNPYDKRLRSSVLIRYGSKNIVIDTTPEFRIQCLRANIKSLDAVLLTHDHSDHLHGIDDLRAFSYFKRKSLPVWGSPQTLETIRKRFGYMWKPTQLGGGVPDLTLQPITRPFTAAGLRITPIPIKHGILDIFGYRIGDVAYMTDISDLPDASLPLLRDLGTMIISCVRYRPHPTHFNIAKAKRLHRLVAPRRTFLTHLTHYVSHKEISRVMPVDVSPAYDTMRIGINI